MHIKGKAWTFGRNVNTDLIFPKMWFRPTYAARRDGEPSDGRHRRGFSEQGRPRRHHRRRTEFRLRLEPRGSGRRHEGSRHRRGRGAELRSAVHAQLPSTSVCPIVTSPRIDEQIKQGDEIEIDLANGYIRNLRSGYEARLAADGAGIAETDRGRRHRQLHAPCARRTTPIRIMNIKLLTALALCRPGACIARAGAIPISDQTQLPSSFRSRPVAPTTSWRAPSGRS